MIMLRPQSLEKQPGGDARAASLFITYLKELPLAAWVEAARWRALVPRMAEAEKALQLVVQHIDAREVFPTREAVLDALQRFECDEGRRVTRGRLSTQHLRPATERAALAVLVRHHLSADDFATLYAPFEPAIPSALLFGLPTEPER